MSQSLAKEAVCAARRVVKGVLERPSAVPALVLSTYHTRPLRFSVTVPVACVAVAVPPVFEVMV